MTIEIVLPIGKKGNVKDLVFTILTREYPLKLIELTNFIRKRYGKFVTFQAVRKAVLELVDEEILVQKENKFEINRDWVRKSKEIIDNLYSGMGKEKSRAKETESIQGEVSIFSFNSLNEMIKFWQDLTDNWFRKFKKGDYNINCYQAAHIWEGLIHPEREEKLWGQINKKGVKSYLLTTGKSALDKQVAKFYSKVGSKIYMRPSASHFDKSYCVGTYGDLVIQTRYPEEITKLLDLFFKKSKGLENLDIHELSEIVNKKIEVKLTVIKNIDMAKQINKSIIAEID